MSKEWKPGEVGLVSSYGHPKPMLFVSEEGGRESWRDANANIYGGPGVPVVLIDPTDREQMERLLDAHNQAAQEAACKGGECGSGSCWIDIMRGTFRIFANPTPPKPPTDVTARITDRRDNIWRLLADGEWVCVDGPDTGEYLTWDALAGDRGPLEVQP